MPDKRSHARFHVRGRVKMHTESEPPAIFEGELLNMSFRGFCVYVKHKEKAADIGADTVVRFELAADLCRKPLTGRGRIRNMLQGGKYGMHAMRLGVEFIDMDRNTIMVFMTNVQREVSRLKAKKGTGEIFI